MNYNKLDYNNCGCSNNRRGIVPESIDIVLKDTCESEIKADIIVKEYDSVRIWGQIKDNCGYPIPKTLVKLLRCDCNDFRGIAHTISDCQGFYQFDLCKKTARGQYKIIAGEAPCCEEKTEQCQYHCRENDHDEGCRHHNSCHCKKSSLCRTCAYYDEGTDGCCFSR